MPYLVMTKHNNGYKVEGARTMLMLANPSLSQFLLTDTTPLQIDTRTASTIFFNKRDFSLL